MLPIDLAFKLIEQALELRRHNLAAAESVMASITIVCLRSALNPKISPSYHGRGAAPLE